MASHESDATDVFDLVGNSTRLEILHALASAYGESPNDPWLRYSELREAVGVRDKGNFNYHLDRLDDLVVAGTQGYRISGLGMRMVTSVASGGLDTEWTWGPVDVPGECLYCDEPVHLHYANGGLSLECETGAHPLGLAASPSLFQTAPTDRVVEHVAFVVNQHAESVRRGLCPDCGAVLDVAIEPVGGYAGNAHYHGDCGRCGMQFGSTVGSLLVGHQDVVAFFAERGIDVRSRPFWTLAFCKAGHEEIATTEPLRVRIEIEHDGDSLSLTLDRDASIVSVERPGDR